jgi:sulfofructose kinase
MLIPLRLPRHGARRFDVVGLGLNSSDMLLEVDEYPGPDTKQRLRGLARLPGGQAATAMVACARLGWKSRYVGRFGGDENGRLSRESLISEGVDVAASSVVEGATNQFAVIIVDARTGARTVLWQRHPGLAMIEADVSSEAVTSGRVLLVDCHETGAATQAARYARAAGIPTVIDVEKVRPDIEGLLRQIDCIIAARDFPSAFTGREGIGEALAELEREFEPAVVCVTLGKEGSIARVAGREIRTTGFPVVPLVDTTGAGDVFRGGFIAGWLAGGEAAHVEHVLDYANAVAALKCRALGARTGIPRRTEVEALLETRHRIQL